MGPLSVEQVLAAEVDAIHGPEHREFHNTLHELMTPQAVVEGRIDKDADTRTGKNEDKGLIEDRKSFYRALTGLNRAALCFSGGGIRSATFGLGIIQALARYIESQQGSAPDRKPISELTNEEIPNCAKRSLLSRFHYLSTVSGGGYIGSWLSAWRTRNDFPTVWKNLAGRPEGPDVEPPEISWLRAYSNYLTPQVGIGSADTWAGVAIYVRNLVLNWLVIVPAAAVVLIILKMAITFAVALARAESLWGLHFGIALFGIACLIIALAYTTRHRPTRRLKHNADPCNDPDNIRQKQFIWHDLFLSLLSAFFLTSALTSAAGVELVCGPLVQKTTEPTLSCSISTYVPILAGALIGLLIYAVSWVVGWSNYGKWNDFWRWTASGLIYGGLVGYGAHLYAGMLPYSLAGKSVTMILLPVILGVPWIMIAQLFADMVFTGLVSYQVNSDSDREWLGRAAGWVIATAVGWALTTFIVFAGAYSLIDVWGKIIAPYIASVGGIAAAIIAWLGKSAKTPAKPGEQAGAMAIAYSIGLAIAGPVFAAILVVGISVGLDLLLLGNSLIEGLVSRSWDNLYIFFWLVVGLAATFFVAAVASRCVNINRFSIHALYRNRLVRAYLGASRQQRCPDNFTGFDNGDNLPAHELWPPKEHVDAKTHDNTLRLFHIVNITLNVVKSTRLAWQERKAESFTVSPLHCGAAYKGYRPSIEYGGGAPCGLSLGTAMAISGAAASPNMGYHSSPSLAILLALFNVRLGWWLGNPGIEGEKTYKDEGPATAIKPLVAETFGLTTDDAPYVYLSDGGHFENLALYEIVRRRCRYIVVVDAGCDPDFTFEDLGNAVRKIYIDLGVRITFSGLEDLKNRPGQKFAEDGSRLTGGKSAIANKRADDGDSNADKIPYHAIGQVRYKEADGAESEDGHIIYIKPAVHFSSVEGTGVRSYASAHETFPHETTGDQFFSESQFESYRSLGLDIMNNVLYRGDPAVTKFLAGIFAEGRI